MATAVRNMLSAAALLLLICQGDAAGKDAARCKLTILYTAQARGQIRSCNCNKFRYGGLGRAATYIRSVRELTPNLLMVEGGDFLAKDSMEGRLKADVFAQYLKMMGYAVVVPGEREAVYPLDYLEKLGKDFGAIITCANMMDAGGKKLLFPPYLVTKLPCGLKVGVIGVLDPQLLAPFGKIEGAPVVVDPEAALKECVSDVRSQCDLVLLVAHASEERAEYFANMARPDIVISTHGSSRERPIAEGETEVRQPTRQVTGSVFFESATQWAWSVGTLDLEVQGGKVVKNDNKVVYLGRAVEEDPEMVVVYNDYEAKTKRLALERKEAVSRQVREALEARRAGRADEHD